MVEKIRWGILGTGAIAAKLAEGLAILSEAELVAVGSRSRASAESFAARFNVPHRHASYEALAADPAVDVVYVATPHPFHKENSLLCLEAGKAVLCEKPFTINAAEAEAVIATARARKLFLMEAMWTRYLPLTIRLREMLAAGVIGDIRMIVADLGFQFDYNPQGRLFNPDLGGGALLDVGIYPVSFASMVFGRQPDRLTGLAHLGRTGVDEEAGVIFGYPQGQIGIIYCAATVYPPQEVILMGSLGTLRVHAPMFCPTRLTLTRPGKPDETVEAPYEGNGYHHEAAEVMRCLRAGRLESETMPLDETLAIMGTMDQIRAQWGLKYPME